LLSLAVTNATIGSICGAREADQDRRKVASHGSLRHLPDGRGRGSATDVCRHTVADRPAAGTTRAKMRGALGLQMAGGVRLEYGKAASTRTGSPATRRFGCPRVRLRSNFVATAPRRDTKSCLRIANPGNVSLWNNQTVRCATHQHTWSPNINIGSKKCALRTQGRVVYDALEWHGSVLILNNLEANNMGRAANAMKPILQLPADALIASSKKLPQKIRGYLPYEQDFYIVPKLSKNGREYDHHTFPVPPKHLVRLWRNCR